MKNLTIACVFLAMSAAPSSAQLFTEVTAAAGLAGPYVGLPNDAQQWIMAGGVAGADYDGDGFYDLFAYRGSARPCALFRNNGDGTFTDVAPAAGVDIQGPISNVTWADYDNDDDLDLYLATYELFIGAATTPGGQVLNFPAGEVQKNSPYGEFRNFLYRNNGDGTFTEVGKQAGVALAGRYGASFGDLDNDGWLDLVSVSHNNGNNWIFRNNGDGTFRDVTPDEFFFADESVRYFTPRIVDYNRDGNFDLLIAGDFKTSALWLNLGDFDFLDVTAIAGVGLDENGMGSTIGDYDNDGDFDWYVTAIYKSPTSQPGNKLYRNNDNGTFTDVTVAAGVDDGFWGWGASFADLNNDQWLDIVHTNGWVFPPWQDDPVRVFRNLGNGTFLESSTEVGIVDEADGRGIVTFDYDNDGDLDVVTNNIDVGLRLWRNEMRGNNDFLEVRLLAKTGNPDGIGAEIKLSGTGVLDQWRLIEYGSNYHSQNPATAWFGLGASARATVDLEISWPSGQVSQHTVDINQRVRVVEP